MTSFGYRLNPRYAIKECLSCGALYTRGCSCSKGSVEDKVLVPKLPENCARCAKCGHPVNGLYCQGCSLLQEKLEEDLVTYLKYFQDTFESSNDSTNVVNAPREPVVVKQDHGINPPHIDECCSECGNALDGIYCQQCICKSCGKGAMLNTVTTVHLKLHLIIRSQCQPPQYTINHPIFNAHNDFLNSQNELSSAQTTIMEQMTQLTSMCELIPACCDDDDDYDSAITPVLSTEEPVDSLSMGDEHLDIIPTTKSDELIKSSVEDLVPIPSESEEISSGSTTTHSDISLSEYNSFIFNFANEEFADEIAHIISPPEYDCFYFWDLPDL
nr:hypothetical protein [Tanacetum cinerariifolium]